MRTVIDKLEPVGKIPPHAGFWKKLLWDRSSPHVFVGKRPVVGLWYSSNVDLTEIENKKKNEL